MIIKYQKTKTLTVRPQCRSADATSPNHMYMCGASCFYCLIEGTLVTTPFGQKRVEEIRDGDLIISYDLDNDQLEIDRVVDTFQFQSQEVYEVCTELGSILVTGEHLFYTKNRGWVKVKHLNQDDELLYDIRDLLEGYYEDNKDQFLKAYKTNLE